tara:strand:+ start:3975 stop:4244 length:270 start_codon:yes stop_codon:yes gene_type:complete
MDLLDRMKEDAKLCNRALRNFEARQIDTKPATKTPGLTRGLGWRNDKLKQHEIDDIMYFTNKGWCVASIATFVGVSKSVVRNYQQTYLP